MWQSVRLVSRSCPGPEDLPSPRRNEYVSKAMVLLYAAIRVRFDILFAVATLSQHCAAPTNKQYTDLEHFLRSVNGTLDKAITMQTGSLNIHVWADASFMTHSDRKGTNWVRSYSWAR